MIKIGWRTRIILGIIAFLILKLGEYLGKPHIMKTKFEYSLNGVFVSKNTMELSQTFWFYNFDNDKKYRIIWRGAGFPEDDVISYNKDKNILILSNFMKDMDDFPYIFILNKKKLISFDRFDPKLEYVLGELATIKWLDDHRFIGVKFKNIKFMIMYDILNDKVTHIPFSKLFNIDKISCIYDLYIIDKDNVLIDVQFYDKEDFYFYKINLTKLKAEKINLNIREPLKDVLGNYILYADSIYYLKIYDYVKDKEWVIPLERPNYPNHEFFLVNGDIVINEGDRYVIKGLETKKVIPCESDRFYVFPPCTDCYRYISEDWKPTIVKYLEEKERIGRAKRNSGISGTQY